MDEHYSMERELVLYKSLMILIQSNTCRGELSNFVKDVLWYSMIIILYRNITYVIKIYYVCNKNILPL